MSQGKAEEAVEALEQYLQDLKALSESEGILTRDELQIAHVLYVTSKHLVVLARVYQKVPDSAREGVGNALIRSTKGHRHFYAVLEGARSGGEAEDGSKRKRKPGIATSWTGNGAGGIPAATAMAARALSEARTSRFSAPRPPASITEVLVET
jgi:hypothetical protein